jgi:ABC-type lipoprotein release transport system permease subunit
MWTLAWRNIWRKKWRSSLTAVAIALVVLLTLVYFGLVGSSQNGAYQNITQNSGHMQVHVAGYRDIRDFDDLLMDDAEQLEANLLEAIAASSADLDSELLANPQVSTVLEVPGLLEGDGRSRGIVLRGIDQPDTVRQRYAAENLSAGTLPAAGDIESIALGDKLATALDVSIGDTVYMYAPGTEGYGAAAFTVTGILNVAGAEGVAISSLLAAQDVGAPDDASRFEIYFPNMRRYSDDAILPRLQSAITSNLADVINIEDYQIETWREVNSSIAGYLDSFEGITWVYTAIFFVLAGLLVMNTVYLSVMERIKEFGVMMALGLKGRKLLRMVVSESLFICGVGAVVGGAVGSLILWRMAQGFTFPGMEELFTEFGLPSVLYASITVEQIITAMLFTIVTGILAALFPAFTAARLEPVEAMRFTAA